MERLIDEDELIKNRVENDPVVIAAKCTPTAYDLDKVVEKLETMRMRYYLTYANTGNKTNDEVWEKASRAVDKAIEIVKGGGIE